MQKRRAYKWLFWGSVATVLLLSLLPVSAPPSFSWQDKVHHFIAYAFLCWLAIRGYGDDSSGPQIGAALIVLGLSVELAQSYTGYRYAESADVVANSAGVIVVIIMVYLRRYLK